MKKMLILVFMLFLLGIANSVLVQKKIITTDFGILGVSVGCASETNDIDVSPVIIDFDDVNIGTHVDRLVSVTNNSSVNLNILTITDPPSPYSIVLDTCTGQSIAPSDTCTFVIRFSPNSVGMFNRTVQILSDNPDENSIFAFLNGTSSALAELTTLTVNPTSATRVFKKCPKAIQFEVIGKDQAGRPVTELGTITWSVQGGIGSINQNGLFYWHNVDTTGTVTATSSIGGLSGTTGSMISRYLIYGWSCGPLTDASTKGTVYPNVPTIIKTNAGEKAIFGDHGEYIIFHPPGNWHLWAFSDGYEPYNMDFTVTEDGRRDKIYLTPKPPNLDPVISTSNLTTLAISGLKAPMASVWLNGLEIIPQNVESVWSYTIQLSNGLNTIDLASKIVSSTTERESSIRSYNIDGDLYNRHTLEEAVDLTSIRLSTGGSSNWEYQKAGSHFDGDAAQSGNISNSQTSYMQTTISGPKVLRFFWKVSSESGYDYLKFYIDGEQQAGICGEVNWTEKEFMIESGSHTLKWAYEKDNFISHGSDSGWVDKIEFDEAQSQNQISITPILFLLL